MKEKRILIAVLLSMAFQAEAARVRGVYENPVDDAADDAKDASKKMPKKDMKEKKEHKKESSSSEGKSKSKKAVKDSSRVQDKMSHKKERKKEEPKKESKEMSRIEREDKKKRDKDRKQEEVRNNKSSELEKRIQKLEKTIDDLENKKAEELQRLAEEKEEKGDKEARKSHVLNHGSVKLDHLDKEIQNHKEMLARKEEAHAKLSDDTREDKRDESRKRASLAKIYENNQRDLREELHRVEDAIKALRVELVEAKNELQDDRAVYEDHLKKRRDAQTHKDSAEAEQYEKMLFAKESDEMKTLLAKQKRILKDLDVIRKKIDENNEAREKAAKEAGILLDLRKEKHTAEVDQKIKEGLRPDANHSRHFTQIAVEMKHRQEDLEAMDKKKMRMRRPTMEEDDVRRTSSKSMKKRPMNDADKDMNMMIMEDQA